MFWAIILDTVSADDSDLETDPGFTVSNKVGTEGHIACAFSFRCPQSWSKLMNTHNPSVRHCTECDRDVHLVWSQAMYDECAKQGHCVAVLTKGRSERPDAADIREAEDTGQVLAGQIVVPEPEVDYEAETGDLDIANMN